MKKVKFGRPQHNIRLWKVLVNWDLQNEWSRINFGYERFDSHKFFMNWNLHSVIKDNELSFAGGELPKNWPVKVTPNFLG
jgi:hypothetical protein